MNLIAIDPGKVQGIAVFENSRLRSAFERTFLDLRVEAIMLRSIAAACTPKRVVVELPQVYPIRKWKGDPNDLISVAVHVGVAVSSFAQSCERVDLVTPRQWKGQMPKEVSAQKTLDKLTEAEKQNIEKIKSSHVLDAIGLGLWALGR